MKNWRRQLAEDLGLPDGGSGGWARRIATALGSTALTGPWMRRATGAAVAAGMTGSWDRRLAQDGGEAGGWNRRAVEQGVSGGGGDAPAWLQALAAPSGPAPTHAMMFQAAQYWNGGAEAAPGAMIGHNTPIGPPFFNDTGGNFNPASITAAGMAIVEGNDNRPVAIGGFSDALCSGQPQTIVFEIDLDQVPSPSFPPGDRQIGTLLNLSGDNSTTDCLVADWYGVSDTDDTVSWEVANLSYGAFDEQATGPGNRVFKIAFTLKANGDVVSSFNGSPAHTDVASQANPGPPLRAWIGFTDTGGPQRPLGGKIRSMRRYVALPDSDLALMTAA